MEVIVDLVFGCAEVCGVMGRSEIGMFGGALLS